MRFPSGPHGFADVVIFLNIIVISGFAIAQVTSAQSLAEPDAFVYSRLLGRGMNIGNALDGPQEGAWGVTLKAEYFQTIKNAGFNSVRIPIRWSAHSQTAPPYTIDGAFFERVDWAINQALARSLAAVIDVHHYAEMDKEPVQNTSQLIALWKQIAARYKSWPPTLLFELFNEPQDKLTDEVWNEVFPKLLQTVRETNPSRVIIIGPGYWNSADHLPLLQLPQDDRRLIATFHYYSPFHFTHQAQDWLAASKAWKGTSWGTAQERDELRTDFDKAAAWAAQQQRPLYLGEFGTSENAAIEARVTWTRAVAREAEKRNISWSYWQFCSNFGVYDRLAESWNQPLLGAMVDTN